MTEWYFNSAYLEIQVEAFGFNMHQKKLRKDVDSANIEFMELF